MPQFPIPALDIPSADTHQAREILQAATREILGACGREILTPRSREILGASSREILQAASREILIADLAPRVRPGAPRRLPFETVEQGFEWILTGRLRVHQA